MPDGRVLIAFDDVPLEPSPTWTRIDDTPNLVSGIDIDRGRASELEQTDTSTATVFLNDTDGLFDPGNVGSPYFGKLDGRQIMLQLWNPVAAEWVTQYRGFIDDYGYDFNPAVNADGEPLVANVAIECVDIFEYLAGVEMIPGPFGDTPPAGSEGVAFYENGPVDVRIEHLLADALIDPLMSVVFSGNIDVQETKYDPGDSILAALRDAADAELPGIANLYTDKIGRIVFHGRLARFDPAAVAPTGDWDFHRWKAGDGAAIAIEDECAQIRPPLRWARPRSRVKNAALCYPRGIAEDDIPGQVVTDSASITAYGYRAWFAPDLIVDSGTTTGNTANDECKLYSDWKIANYSEARTTVEALTFRSIDPDDDRALRTWALICGQDISDTVQLMHGYPGGAGIDELFYIEGSSMQIRPLNGDFDDVTLTLNVSPESDYGTDVFTT